MMEGYYLLAVSALCGRFLALFLGFPSLVQGYSYRLFTRLSGSHLSGDIAGDCFIT